MSAVIPDNTQVQPAKKGNPWLRWTDEEENALVSEMEEGLSLEQAAAKHSRSVPAIDMRLAQIATKMIAEGADPVDCQSKLKYTTAGMKKFADKKETAKNKKAKAATLPVETPVVKVAPLPYAATPQDRVLALRQYKQRLEDDVAALKAIGANDEDLEEQIKHSLAYTAILIEKFQTKLVA